MTKEQQRFVATVWQYWRQAGRHQLPWRATRDPYRILVSEVMLQQTQVDRVIPKYQAFLRAFPTVKKLAEAPLGDVLRLWQGLGYNRRAKLLQQCARAIRADHRGRFPQSYEALVQLPGVGPYTAGAIIAFAFNEPVTMIETNIRTVYLHHFFNDQTDVSDTALLPRIRETVDAERPREWYWALMDYGAHLKKSTGNPNRRSRSYTKQSKFAGSDRQIRGAIIRVLGEGSCTKRAIYKKVSDFATERIDEQLAKLQEEGLVEKGGQRFALPA